MIRSIFVNSRRSSDLKPIPAFVAAFVFSLQWLSLPLTAGDMSPRLLTPEPPSNYKVTITRSYDAAINWQITVLDGDNLYASGRETDPEDEAVTLSGNVWLRNGQPGENGDLLSLGEALGMANTVYLLYPYTLVPEASGLQEMIDGVSDKTALENNAAIEEMRGMHREKVEQAITENFQHMSDKPCGDSTCSVFRQVFINGGIDDPGYADFYIDPDTGYVQRILSFHAKVTVDGETIPEWTETALFEYDVAVQWPDGSS